MDKEQVDFVNKLRLTNNTLANWARIEFKYGESFEDVKLQLKWALCVMGDKK